MSVVARIDNLVAAANTQIKQQKRKKKIHLYAEGFKSKIRHADYALQQLSSFSDRTDETATTTATDEFEISERVGFYCDAFWAFLYSSLDILAHVINQSRNLKMDEKDVSFKNIAKQLEASCKGTPLQKKVDKCLKATSFKNVEAYRNCSTHRRQIYIKEETKIVRHTAGYHTTVTGSVESVNRLICDNPLDVVPKTNQKREVPEYLESTKNSIMNHIEAILKNITPL